MKTEAVLLAAILGVWGLSISAHADPWRGAAGPFTFTDCNINGDTAVNVADRSIANAVWRGVLGQNSVSAPCPFR